MIVTYAYPQKRRRSSCSFQVGNFQTKRLFIWWTILSVIPTTTARATEEPSFLNLPLTYRTNQYHDAKAKTIISHVVCAGETFSNNSAVSHRYRSCQFQNLCYNIDSQEYILFPSPEEVALQALLMKLPSKDFVTVSSMAHDSHASSSSTISSTKKVSLGTIRRSIQPSPSSIWFPNIIMDIDLQQKLVLNGYYKLPDDAVVFPIVLPSATEPTSTRVEALLWLDFFVIHTVLSMFGLEQNKQPIFIIHNENNDIPKALLASPIWSIFGNETSKHLGRFNHPTQMNVVPNGSHAATTATMIPKSNLICSKHSVAGLGMIATVRDESKLLLTHAMGRGALIYAFRNYILSNLGIKPSPSLTQQRPDNSIISSRSPQFQITIAGLTESEFEDLKQELGTHLPKEYSLPTKLDIEIRRVDNDLSFPESIALTATSSIHVTTRLGPPHMLATATCLPRGATLIVLDATADPEDDSDNVDVDRVEHDYLEMAGYFHLHWLNMPLSSNYIDNSVKDSISTILRKKLQSVIKEQ